MKKEIKELITEARENIDAILHVSISCDDSRHTVCYFGERGNFQISTLGQCEHTRREQISFGWCGSECDVVDYINHYEEDESC